MCFYFGVLVLCTCLMLVWGAWVFCLLLVLRLVVCCCYWIVVCVCFVCGIFRRCVFVCLILIVLLRDLLGCCFVFFVVCLGYDLVCLVFVWYGFLAFVIWLVVCIVLGWVLLADVCFV